MTMEKIKIARARVIDIKKIIEIEELSYRDPWPREVFMIDYVFNSSSRYYVVKIVNKIVAFMGIWVEERKLHIINIAVHPEYRNKGIAKALLNSSIDYANKNRLKEIYLEVRKSNNVAQNLYKQFDFEIVEDLQKYYQDGEDGYRMIKIIELNR
jgi:ribosomal-protein-alanine N-acetyltransferase